MSWNRYCWFNVGTVRPRGMARRAVIFKRMDGKKRIIILLDQGAEAVRKKRNGLPPVYTDPKDVTEIPEGMRQKDKTILRLTNAEELLRLTKNDMA